MQNIIGIDPIPAEFKWLEKTLEMRIEINLEYAKVMKGEDAIYWYNERANVGAFAGAAWRSGMCAVEEYTALKTRKSPTSKDSGRIDLYLVKNHESAVVEAKICWFGPSTTIPTLSAKMRSARIDAKCDNEGDQKIGAVFYVLRLTENEVNKEVLNEMIKRIRKTKPHILTWCFPSCLRKLKTDKKENEGFVWPGVILAMKDPRYVR